METQKLAQGPVRTSLVRVVRFYAWIFSILIVAISASFITYALLGYAGMAGLLIPFAIGTLAIGLIGIYVLLRSNSKLKNNKTAGYVKQITVGLLVSAIILVLGFVLMWQLPL